MDTPTFTTFVADERRRIHDAIKMAKAKRQEADQEIAQLEAQLTAISAYDAALKGTSVADKPRAARGRRGESVKRSAISLQSTLTVSPVGNCLRRWRRTAIKPPSRASATFSRH